MHAEPFAHCLLCVRLSLSLSSVGLVSGSWQSGTVSTSASYSAYSKLEVNGTVGLYMGLSGFNVTLVGDPRQVNTTVGGGGVGGEDGIEEIDYNEYVGFGVRQGM